MSTDRFTKQQKIDILEWELWNETSYPFPAVDPDGQCKQDTIKGLLDGFENGGDPQEAWDEWYSALVKKYENEHARGNCAC